MAFFVVLLFLAVTRDRARRAVWKFGRRLRGPELKTTAEFNTKLGRSKLLTTELPDGVMVRHDGACGLLAADRFLPWTHRGYLDPVALRPTTQVELLTPPSIVAAIAAGYRPLLHPSAGAGLA